jgi:SagB-type dehydrogenase family enzyme
MDGKRIELPDARNEGEMSVEAAISRRRSHREFSEKQLSLQQLAQLAWCAQGITGGQGRKRAAPSAGATYPMCVVFAVGQKGVEGLEAGVYRYIPEEHMLKQVGTTDVRRRIAGAALGQGFLAEAPVVILLAANYSRTARRYGERARRYVHMEAGHVGQNIHLQAEALGLATVAVGAFDDENVAEVVGLPDEMAPLYLMPVGHPR